MEHAIKYKEVWREGGKFAKAPEPTPVAVEPEVKTDESGFVVASFMFGSTAIVLAIVFWKVALSLAGGTAIVFLVQKYIKERTARKNRPQLQVNELGKRKVIYL